MAMNSGHIRRRLMTGVNATIVTLMVILGVVLTVDLAQTHRVRFDLSDDSSSTLSSQTLALMDRLDADNVRVTITAFSSQPNTDSAHLKDRVLRDFLREVSTIAPQIEHRFVSFDADRVTAESLGVTSYGTVVVTALDDRVDIPSRQLFRRAGEGHWGFVGEPVITRAVHRLLRGQSGVVYALTGHGERSVSGGAARSVTQLAALLQTRGVDLVPLDLLSQSGPHRGSVPTDAAAVLIIGPEMALAPVEESALSAYLSTGGRLGVFVDPTGFVPDILEGLGVLRLSGVVHDDFALYPHAQWPVLRPRRHPITAPLIETGVTLSMATGAALDLFPVAGAIPAVLLTTSQRAWRETGADIKDRAVQTVATAIQVTSEHPLVAQGVSSRVLVFGDADIFSDELLAEVPGNKSLAQNSLQWLMGEEDNIETIARDTSPRRLIISGQQLRWVMFMLMGVLPVVILLVAASRRASRRSR